MIEVDVPASSAIMPRMSVCLKGTTKFLEGLDLSEEFDLSDSEQEASLSFTKADFNDDEDENNEISASRRSPLSASSVMLTGTSYSILRTSPANEACSKRRQEKLKIQSNGIRFSESVHVRNHIHARDITDSEKLAAWFRKPEYKTIFKNNTQIISIIEKRERELKRMMAKKQRENKKKKGRKNLNMGLNMSLSKSIETPNPELTETSCSEVIVGEEELSGEDFGIDDIIGIHRDDERGFSIRGLENETAKKRRIRDQTYLKAKFAVLSVQEDIDEHMFSLQEQHEEKLATISRGKKKGKRRFSLNRQMAPAGDREEDSEKIQKMVDAAKEEFASYAKAQYKSMIRMIAEKYADICRQDAKDALERGIRDEKTVKAIDWIESEGDNSHVSILSSAKGMSDSSQDQEKRRPSTTSTAPTEISAASALGATEGMKLSGVKRAKIFLSKFV